MNSLTAAIQDMGINHRGAHVFVSQDFLNCVNVVTVLNPMRGER